MERLRGSTHQQHRDDLHELQIGRLKQDRVHVPRGGDVSSPGAKTELRGYLSAVLG